MREDRPSTKKPPATRALLVLCNHSYIIHPISWKGQEANQDGGGTNEQREVLEGRRGPRHAHRPCGALLVGQRSTGMKGVCTRTRTPKMAAHVLRELWLEPVETPSVAGVSQLVQVH